MADGDTNVASITSKQLDVRGCHPGTAMRLTREEKLGLCLKSRDIFPSQPTLLELEAPIRISGYIHGQHTTCCGSLRTATSRRRPTARFLGDDAHRGRQSLETICLLLAYKIEYAENLFLLRGSH
ncbi:hypothetical protein HPB48_022780 [Haemaphysalis longicornis]|uniref:protein-serine/threonine phosphatase n=1 Tax=Haemaphysalis longicornis TaxID=44386 RepID=A0A9J6GZT7_HAELO|nr:hypothetical protein HPB48_022780 [Haemaphysalis longicornis]